MLLVVHLVNLTGQHDTLWDAPRDTQPGDPGVPARVRIRRSGSGLSPGCAWPTRTVRRNSCST